MHPAHERRIGGTALLRFDTDVDVQRLVLAFALFPTLTSPLPLHSPSPSAADLPLTNKTAYDREQAVARMRDEHYGDGAGDYATGKDQARSARMSRSSE